MERPTIAPEAGSPSEVAASSAGLPPAGEAAPPGAGTAPAATSFTQALGLTWEEVRGVLQERMRLFSLEAQRSGLALVQIVLYGVMAAVLVVTAWLALMGGIAVWLVLNAGFHWAVAVVVIAASNVVVAAVLGAAMRKLVPQLGFPATVRQLRGGVAPQPPGPRS